MAKEKKSKEDVEEAEDKKPKLTGSKGILSSMLQDHKGDHYNHLVRKDWRISWGSLLLDAATGGVRPSLVRLAGTSNQGKTPQALELLRQLFLTVPNSKGLWLLAEGRGLSDENKERSQLKFVYNEEEWEVGTVFVLESNIAEFIIDLIKKLVKNNEEGICFGFVLDSGDGLQLRDDQAKDMDKAAKVAGTPSISKRMLQQLSLGMFKFGHLLVWMSQVSADITGQYETKAYRAGNFGGGNALIHSADWILEYQPTYLNDYITDPPQPTGKLNDGKTIVLGKYAKAILQKSSREKSKGKMVRYPILYGRKPSGIWVEKEIIDLMLGWEMFVKKGSWLALNESLTQDLQKEGFLFPEQLQGQNQWLEFLETNQDITKFLYDKIQTLIT